VFYDTFEEFPLRQEYDTVVAGSVLEFYQQPSVLLEACKRFLKPKGRLIVTTPNALSLHRRVGAIMKVESSPLRLNVSAVASACHHLYTLHSLREAIESSGLLVRTIVGAHLKVLPAPLMRAWPDELLDAFDAVSSEMSPDFCKMLMAICDAP
jgi:2-polyprenyl-3-methyl-5-hydroxy-6-metoxy-1,4-benzoquinol methylase